MNDVDPVVVDSSMQRMHAPYVVGSGSTLHRDARQHRDEVEPGRADGGPRPVDDHDAIRCEQQVVGPNVEMHQRVASHRLGPSRLELDQIIENVPDADREAFFVDASGLIGPCHRVQPSGPFHRGESAMRRHRPNRRASHSLAGSSGTGDGVKTVASSCERVEHPFQLVGAPGQVRRPSVDVVEREHDPLAVVPRPRNAGAGTRAGNAAATRSLAAVDRGRVGIRRSRTPPSRTRARRRRGGAAPRRPGEKPPACERGGDHRRSEPILDRRPHRRRHLVPLHPPAGGRRKRGRRRAPDTDALSRRAGARAPDISPLASDRAGRPGARRARSRRHRRAPRAEPARTPQRAVAGGHGRDAARRSTSVADDEATRVARDRRSRSGRSPPATTSRR